MAEPTNWSLAGSGIYVRYSVAGPHMHFHHGTVIRDFTGSQITVNEVPALGTLASVTLAIVPDSGSTTFTLFLPHVNLPAPPALPAAVPVTTEAVTTNHHTSIAPQTLHGQLARILYRYLPSRVGQLAYTPSARGCGVAL